MGCCLPTKADDGMGFWEEAVTLQLGLPCTAQVNWRIGRLLVCAGLNWSCSIVVGTTTDSQKATQPRPRRQTNGGEFGAVGPAMNCGDCIGFDHDALWSRQVPKPYIQ